MPWINMGPSVLDTDALAAATRLETRPVNGGVRTGIRLIYRSGTIDIIEYDGEHALHAETLRERYFQVLEIALGMRATREEGRGLSHAARWPDLGSPY